MSWKEILKVNPVAFKLISGSTLWRKKKPSEKLEEEEVEKIVPAARVVGATAAAVLDGDDE